MDDLGNGGGDFFAQSADRRHGLQAMCGQLLQSTLALIIGEHDFTGQQLVKRAAHAVDVSADIDAMAVGDLLRGHVIGRAHDLADAGHVAPLGRLAVQSGQAQVEQLDHAVAGEHEIRGLDVAMVENALPPLGSPALVVRLGLGGYFGDIEVQAASPRT